MELIYYFLISKIDGVYVLNNEGYNILDGPSAVTNLTAYYNADTVWKKFYHETKYGSSSIERGFKKLVFFWDQPKSFGGVR